MTNADASDASGGTGAAAGAEPPVRAVPTLTFSVSYAVAVTLHELLGRTHGGPPQLHWFFNALHQLVETHVPPAERVQLAERLRVTLPRRLDLRDRSFYARYVLDPGSGRWVPHPDAARLNGLPTDETDETGDHRERRPERATDVPPGDDAASVPE